MSERIAKLDPPDSISAMGPKRKTERASLDFEAWRAHLAAPGSKFKSTRPQPPRIVRLDTVLPPSGCSRIGAAHGVADDDRSYWRPTGSRFVGAIGEEPAMSVREDRPSMMVMHPRKSVQRKIAVRRQRGARREDRNPCAGYMMGSADAASARSHAAQSHGAWILSRRELEVLRLVASGETDRAIADALFVSIRTVNSHVSTILAKLDVSSRCAAVMTAARIGLL